MSLCHKATIENTHVYAFLSMGHVLLPIPRLSNTHTSLPTGRPCTLQEGRRRCHPSQRLVLQRKDKVVQRRETAVQWREKAVQRREKAVQRREKAVQQREKAVQRREKAVQRKEKAVQQREKAVQQNVLHRKFHLSVIAAFFPFRTRSVVSLPIACI
ncbi:unnamed protein product [Closterium sp. NIES-65]|nr:unnamed protein product [Closterium sp. NIES-65]